MSRPQHVAKYRCIETIAPQRKKDWRVVIGRRYVNLNYLMNEEVWNRPESENMEENNTSNGLVRRLHKYNPPGITESSLYEIIEEDPLQSFDYIQRESVKNGALLPRLSLYLPGKAMEIICNKIFSKKNVNEEFVEMFYETFFSLFLMRRYTWFSLHLLVKASKAYPNHFKTTLSILLREQHIGSTVLQDFIEHINTTDCTNLMKHVIELQFSPEVFDRILPVLYLMYKKSEKPISIFKYVYTNLQSFSQFCAYNVNYGRLLLYFIQNISGREIIYNEVRTIIEHHCTPYKRPCLAALDKYFNDRIGPEENFPEEYRIIIPRPSDDVIEI